MSWNLDAHSQVVSCKKPIVVNKQSPLEIQRLDTLGGFHLFAAQSLLTQLLLDHSFYSRTFEVGRDRTAFL